MNNFIKKSKKFFEIIAGSFYLKVGRGLTKKAGIAQFLKGQTV